MRVRLPPPRRLIPSMGPRVPISSGILLSDASPILPLLLLPRPSDRRTILNWFKGGSSGKFANSQDPLYAEYLTKKPPPPPAPTTGDLASGSIFNSEEDGSPKPNLTRKKAASHTRNPRHMQAVLDPDPASRQRWERKMVIREIKRRGRLTKTQLIQRTERESLSKSRFLKTSVKKLGPLARQIVGKTVDDALVQMRFSKKKMAKEVKEHLEHARNEAVVRRGMALGNANGTAGAPARIETKEGKKRLVTDRTQLYIDQAWVGRGKYGFAPDHRARGAIYAMRPPVTSISVVLKEEATRIRQHREREEKRHNRKLWVQLPHRPITAQRQYYSW